MNNRILVVDDEIDVMVLFQQRFRKEIRNGVLAFKFAKSGREAMDILHEDEPMDVMLILSDINMPGMNGFELLRETKRSWPRLPVMMITAYGDEANRRQAAELGATEFLTKPIDFTALKTKLMQLIRSS